MRMQKRKKEKKKLSPKRRGEGIGWEGWCEGD